MIPVLPFSVVVKGLHGNTSAATDMVSYAREYEHDPISKNQYQLFKIIEQVLYLAAMGAVNISKQFASPEYR